MYQIINNLLDINLSESRLQLTNSNTRGHPFQLMQLLYKLMLTVISYKNLEQFAN